MRPVFFFVHLALVTLAGCSQSPRRVVPPHIDSVAAGRQAVGKYDTSGDGLIDGSELERAAPLKAALATLDTNNDQALSAEEITSRIQSHQKSKVGMMPVLCRVQLDGKPVEGALVTFVPEEFLGTEIRPCSGKTDSQGFAVLSIDEPELHKRRINGAHCGFYRVQVNALGIPAQYTNQDSPLGVEVAHDVSSMRTGFVFSMNTKNRSPTNK